MNKRSALGDKAVERYKALSKEIKRKEKKRKDKRDAKCVRG